MLRRKMEMDESPSKRRKVPKHKNSESGRKLTIITDAEEEKNIMQEKHYLEIVESGDMERCSEEEEGEPLAEGNGLSIVGNNLLMGLDNTNYRLIRYTEDGTAEVVSAADADVDGVVVTSEDGHPQQFLQFTNAGLSEDGTIQGTLETHETDDTEHIRQHRSVSQPHVQYVQVVERDQVPLVYFTAGPEGLTPTIPNVGRRKRGEFVLPTDTSKFKMFLYSCKLCDFKCNAIKELTAHRSIHQASGGAGRFRNLSKIQHSSSATIIAASSPSSSSNSATSFMHCGLCNFKATSKLQMVRHNARSHNNSRISQDKNESEDDLSSGLSEKDHHGQKYEANKQQITFYHCETCDLQTASKHAYKKHACNQRQSRL